MIFFLRDFSSFLIILLKFLLLLNINLTQTQTILSNIRISTGDSTIYDKNGLNSYYDYNSQKKYSCVIPNVLEDNNQIPQRIITIENTQSDAESNNDLTLEKIEIASQNEYITIKNNFTTKVLIKNGYSSSIRFDYICSNEILDNSDVWSLVTFNLKFAEIQSNISFSYIKICQYDDSGIRFDAGYLLLALISVIIVGFAARFNSLTILRNDFKRFEISWIFAFLYFIICSFSIVLIYYLWKVAIIVYMVIIAILACISLFVVLYELFKIFPIQFQCKFRLPFPYLKKITVGSIFIALISITLVIIWGCYRYYIIADICAFAIVIFCLKIFQMSSIKRATLFIITEMLFELMWGFIINNAMNNSYDIFFSSALCIPIRVVIPTLNQFLHQNCTWMLVSSLIFPGLALCYLHKFDASKNIHIYFRIGFFAYIIGAALWVIVLCVSGQMVPLSFFGYPLILGFVMILSYLRNEHTELWNGSFFDSTDSNRSIEEANSSQQNFKSQKSLNSNYNKEEIFEGLLSKKASRQSSELNSNPIQIQKEEIIQNDINNSDNKKYNQ